MSLEAITAGLDPLGWAKHPQSQQALDAITLAAKEGDERFVAIRAQLVADGVCDESGKLLMRWDGLRWVSLAADRERYAA